MDTKKGIGIALVVGAAVVAGSMLFGKKEEEEYPDNIVLSNLQIIPSEVEVGETVEISCIAYNAGEERATREITLEVS